MEARISTYTAAAGVFALDRVTKWLVETRVSPWETYVVIPRFVNIVHSRNPGAVFGLFSGAPGAWRSIFLAGLSAVAIILLAALLWKPSGTLASRRTLSIGLTLILGGALGNVYDRIMLGTVTDFLDVYIGDYHWFTFNVADSAITSGGALFLLDMWRGRRKAAP